MQVVIDCTGRGAYECTDVEFQILALSYAVGGGELIQLPRNLLEEFLNSKKRVQAPSVSGVKLMVHLCAIMTSRADRTGRRTSSYTAGRRRTRTGWAGPARGRRPAAWHRATICEHLVPCSSPCLQTSGWRASVARTRASHAPNRSGLAVFLAARDESSSTFDWDGSYGKFRIVALPALSENSFSASV